MSNDTAWLALDDEQRQRIVDRFWSRVGGHHSGPYLEGFDG